MARTEDEPCKRLRNLRRAAAGPLPYLISLLELLRLVKNELLQAVGAREMFRFARARYAGGSRLEAYHTQRGGGHI